ncbi:HD domain-containing protein [Psychromarinibacter sp. C21-152]|uniref:HD domain-containing protein n=1 Tax=Psychromarinibacter sediminicola TaxID=3033385 RepID=A0AAE3NT63_9RHOB|nr:HD domain-containing protein [Psychromarinibacter sediminicola]MDF0601601.1 HD domain-containing protein [Psychromarinibacter sediminicola]
MSLARVTGAASFAAEAHAGQMRKGGGRPYINHPLEVAAAVAEDGADADIVCAALLHDVVEDTDVAAPEIAARFGDRVAALVDELTDRPEWEALPTPDRKARQAEEFRSASAAARQVKIADQWSNVAELAAVETGHDAGWLAAYLRAARATVAVCRPASPGLAARFDGAAEKLERKIGGMGQ